MLPQAQVDHLLQAMDAAVDDVVQKIDSVHGPHWESRSDLVRNLVGVGSAVFAGTIALADGIVEGSCYGQIVLVLSSWVLMLVSVGAGLYVLWYASNLRSFYPKYFNQRPVIEQRLAALNPASPSLVQDTAAIFKDVIDGAINPVGVADRRAHIAVRICIALFFLSLTAFLGYAVWRFGSGA